MSEPLTHQHPVRPSSADRTNDFVVKAYDRFNGYVGVGVGDHWDIRLTARNIADDQQVYVGSRGLGGYLMLPPREVMLTLSYKL